MEWFIKSGGDAENIPGYDCKLSDRKPGAKDFVLGTAFIAYGLFAEMIYILDLMVMVKKQHRRLSCYKIMIALGIYDMAAISLNSLLTGYFWIQGTNYCTNPTLMFVAGSIALGLWCGACMNCFVLVINRLLDVWNKNIMQALFKDERTYVVLLIPLTYSLYFCFFTTPLLFNSDQTAWFFFTFAPEHDPEMYYNYPHTANNLLIVVITCLLYVQYSRVLLRHSKVGSGLSWAQKSFFLQCSSICMANLIAALIYVYMQFFLTPSYFVLIGHVCWQLGHGENFLKHSSYLIGLLRRHCEYLCIERSEK
ncbi:hypothetical protein ANCCAN_16571 [Ancylostoma caninum]|uniref:7TM GPCR serpentine receptor class x (Srx) domain-containing protein n=1 Tax=Ancylostoma caninum TaxID=29170 RepID=A0A368FZA2_ANCCA|nr:hypothetical protein ANCCAN_16571 [Ancylostoma caninum]